ncbi:MAG: SAM-dependent methyltransferase [Bacteroidales bacterium]|nr:SAM-dependent methyltransferase [Bacteroidales bacterium]
MKTGKLYLIPTIIGETDLNKVIPAYNIEIINNIDEFIVEKEKTARRFLKKIGINKPLDSLVFHLLNKNTKFNEITSYLDVADIGKNIAILSEAGSPCIADPGSEIVKMAHKKNIQVIPLIGPSSILLSLMASGFNGQNFTFHGYLPIEKKARINKINQLEKNAYRQDQTQIFIEAPYRNKQLLEAILRVCSKETLLCIACNLTQTDEYIASKTISEWKRQIPDIHKKTTVFLIYK